MSDEEDNAFDKSIDKMLETFVSILTKFLKLVDQELSKKEVSEDAE